MYTLFPSLAETDRQTDRQTGKTETGTESVCERGGGGAESERERGGDRERERVCVCVCVRERERERGVSPGLSTFIQKRCKMNYDVRLRSDWKVLLTTACFCRGLAT